MFRSRKKISFLIVILFFAFLAVRRVTAGDSNFIYSSIRLSVCGDLVAEFPEQCDNADLRGQSCQSLGLTGGQLDCDIACDFNKINCIGTPTPSPTSVPTPVLFSPTVTPITVPTATKIPSRILTPTLKVTPKANPMLRLSVTPTRASFFSSFVVPTKVPKVMTPTLIDETKEKPEIIKKVVLIIGSTLSSVVELVIILFKKIWELFT